MRARRSLARALDVLKNDEMTPSKAMESGRKILEPVLGPHGWTFVPGPSGGSSGGQYAQADFIRGDRRLELHFRHALGLVTYHLGSASVSHEAYMEVLLGRRGASRYPGFSDDPLDSFRGLADDLLQHGMDFVAGPGEHFQRCVERADKLAKVSGFKKLASRQDV